MQDLADQVPCIHYELHLVRTSRQTCN